MDIVSITPTSLMWRMAGKFVLVNFVIFITLENRWEEKALPTTQVFDNHHDPLDVVFRAKAAIRKGEELTISYGDRWSLDHPRIETHLNFPKTSYGRRLEESSLPGRVDDREL